MEGNPWILAERYNKENSLNYNSATNLLSTALSEQIIKQFQPDMEYGLQMAVLAKHIDNSSNTWIDTQYLLQGTLFAGTPAIPFQTQTGQRSYFFPDKNGITQVLNITGLRSINVQLTLYNAIAAERAAALGTTLEQPGYVSTFNFYRRKRLFD